MTPRDRLVVHTGPISLADAERVMTARKVKKLPLVNADGTVLGLITAKDLIKHREHPFATRDEPRPPAGRRGGRRDRRLSRARQRGGSRRRRRARHRHRSRPLAGDGARPGPDQASGFPSVDVDRRKRRHRRGRRVSGRAGRQRHQGRHRTRRRLHDAADDELRRAAGRGDRAVPASRSASACRSSPTAASGATAALPRRCSSAAKR